MPQNAFDITYEEMNSKTLMMIPTKDEWDLIPNIIKLYLICNTYYSTVNYSLVVERANTHLTRLDLEDKQINLKNVCGKITMLESKMWVIDLEEECNLYNRDGKVTLKFRKKRAKQKDVPNSPL